ncbi:hypothetical protein GQ607_015631 [Colletotrichum asianum]|uniref:Ankyrin repeat protein n=1 Tax=Colletotrichum asianum TaxID=702518 RepID=A0A8H3VZJ5_9PEZI|nr:hypothetical protein GQ607_015631 [Colletotrichum asianum]
MPLPIEITSRVGVSKDDIEYYSFRKWLTPILACATIHPDESKSPVQVGKAVGFIIRRDAVQSAFHEMMESPNVETMDLALDLFDRYGRLKEEFCEHPLRKGSGVWKRELNEGNFILIDDVNVERIHRRKQVGSKLILHLLEQAMRPQHNAVYAFSRAAAHYDDNEGVTQMGPSNTPIHIKIEGVTSFLRSLHFRRVGLTSWFALARDRKHPSWRLAPDKDSDPKLELDDLIDSDSDGEVIQIDADLGQSRVKESEWRARWLGITPIKTLPDKDALTFLNSHTRDGILEEEFPLQALDGRGDTILHIAAKASKPGCVAWLLRQTSFAAVLLKADNYAGYTPLEALQAKLETDRVQKAHGFSRMRLVADEFDGFDKSSTTCLLLLQGIGEPSSEQRTRATFGCTCNECLEGFLSPRMLMKLSEQAQREYGYMTSLLVTPPGHKGWYMEFKDLLKYFSKQFRSQVRASKPLQTAIVLVMGAVAKCLSSGEIPRESAVVGHLKADEAWARIENLFFRKGGTVNAVLSVVFVRARLLDIEVGDAIINEDPEEYYKGIPKCRNDLEFDFVRRHCVDKVALETTSEKSLPVPSPWIGEIIRQFLEGKVPFGYHDVDN